MPGSAIFDADNASERRQRTDESGQIQGSNLAQLGNVSRLPNSLESIGVHERKILFKFFKFRMCMVQWIV